MRTEVKQAIDSIESMYGKTEPIFKPDIWAKFVDDSHDHWVDAMRYAFMEMPEPIPLTRWQRFKRFMTKRRYVGLWVTERLMKHYGLGSDYDY